MQTLIFNAFIGIYLFIAASPVLAYDLGRHAGLYKIVAKECYLSQGLYNPCPETLFIELVKGKFQGICPEELALVRWRRGGNSTNLLYTAHSVEDHQNRPVEENRIWLQNKDQNNEQVQEYFLLEQSEIIEYRYLHTRLNQAGEKIVRDFKYVLSHTSREAIGKYMLIYPGATDLSPNSPSTLRLFTFKKANIRLLLPADWEYVPPNKIIGKSCSVDCRLEAKDSKTTLQDYLQKVEAVNKNLAEDVKENQYYLLQGQEYFQSPTGVKGIKSIYGYSLSNPSAINYFFLKDQQTVTLLRLRFHTWQTEDIWKSIDKMLLLGLQRLMAND